MNEEQLQRIVKNALDNALDQRDRIDHESHRADHEWVKLQREREKRWNDNVELAKKSAIGFLTIGILTLLIKGTAFIGGLVLAAFGAARGEPPATGG